MGEFSKYFCGLHECLFPLIYQLCITPLIIKKQVMKFTRTMIDRMIATMSASRSVVPSFSPRDFAQSLQYFLI
jgi:hypothetical protein